MNKTAKLLTTQVILAIMARWRLDDWQQTMPGEGDHEPPEISRQWVIWQLIEHDLLHGGEISLTLKMYNLTPPDT
jgi:hypothetical protein